MLSNLGLSDAGAVLNSSPSEHQDTRPLSSSFTGTSYLPTSSGNSSFSISADVSFLGKLSLIHYIMDFLSVISSIF